METLFIKGSSKEISCVPREISSREMNDCCSDSASWTCFALALLCFLMFLFALAVCFFALRRQSRVRREGPVAALYVTICLCLLSRCLYFLNNFLSKYFSSTSYCLYMSAQYLPVCLLAIADFIFTFYVWYMSECTISTYQLLEERLKQKKRKYNRITIGACAVVVVGTVVFTITDCQGGDNKINSADLFLVLFLLLAVSFFAAGAKLLTNLRREYPMLYRTVKWKVIGISVGGGLAMLFRASLTAVFVIHPHDFDRFKEQSLMNNTWDYPIFLVAFLLLAEILPLFCFLMFLLMSIHSPELGTTAHSSIARELPEYEEEADETSSFSSDRI